MKRVGLLVGQEITFPEALIAEINRRDRGVRAEMVKLGATPMNASCHYDVLVDRISHEVPFYQCYLKNAVLQGTYVINNPFWRIADDKYFESGLAHTLGVAVPRTVILPNKDYVPGVVSESLRNLEYPLDWDGILAYTGLPAVLKSHWGGGWKDVFVINNRDELLHHYGHSGTNTLILQEFVHWQQYVRVIVIGRKDVLPILWNPLVPHHERYHAPQPPLTTALRRRIKADALKLCDALGYDMNTVEFAVRDGVPVAIDFMNSAPDFDISSLGEHYFSWVVDKMADHAIRYALEHDPEEALRKPAFLSQSPVLDYRENGAAQTSSMSAINNEEG
jgi:hypothetical protein